MNFPIFNIFFLQNFAFFANFFTTQAQQQMQQQPTAAGGGGGADALGTRGVAPPSDIASNCAMLGAFCQHNVYRAYMQRCCAATCGNTGQQTCADRRGDLCSVWNERAGFCQNNFYPNTFKADLCAFTCSLCELRQQMLQLGINSNGARAPIELSCQQMLNGAGGGGNHGELVPPLEVQQPHIDLAGGTAAPPLQPPPMQPPMAPQQPQLVGK